MVLPNWLLTLTEYIGLVAAAISGSMIAIERGLDLFGVVFLGIVTALGGGILRDTLIGSYPPRFFVNEQWVLTVFLVSLLVFFIARIWNGWRKPLVHNRIEQIRNVFDAVGLAAFTISGMQITAAAGYGDNVLLCVSMGMLTGFGGGIMRDVMCKEIPFVLRKHIYALASMAGGILYWFLLQWNIGHTAATLLGGGLIVLIRLLATVFRWSLPHIPAKNPATVTDTDTETETENKK